MRSLVCLTWREFLLQLREPFAAFFTLVFPPLLVLICGSIFDDGAPPQSSRLGTIDLSTPGYITLIITTLALSNLLSPSLPTEHAAPSVASRSRRYPQELSSVPRVAFGPWSAWTSSRSSFSQNFPMVSASPAPSSVVHWSPYSSPPFLFPPSASPSLRLSRPRAPRWSSHWS